MLAQATMTIPAKLAYPVVAVDYKPNLEKPVNIFHMDASVLWSLLQETLKSPFHDRPERREENVGRGWRKDKRICLFPDIFKCCALACANSNDPRSPLPYNLDTKSPVGPLSALFALTRFQGSESMGICDASNNLIKLDDKVVCNFNVDSNLAEAIDGVITLNVLVRAGKRIQGDHFSDADGHPVLARVIFAAEKVVKAGTSSPLGTLVVSLKTCFARLMSGSVTLPPRRFG
jgi:hypothetical protein